MTDMRFFVDGSNTKWLAVTDVAKKIGKTLQTVLTACNKNGFKLSLKPHQTSTRAMRFMLESDLIALLTRLRITGEFADSFRQIQDNVINKGLEAIKPTSTIKHFQRFPDPTAIVPDKPIRASVVEYVRKVAITLKQPYNAVFNTLYTEFKYRHGIDLARHTGYKSGLDKCFDLEKLPDLYALARKMFDSKLPEDELIIPEVDDYDKLPPVGH